MSDIKSVALGDGLSTVKVMIRIGYPEYFFQNKKWESILWEKGAY